MVKTPKYLFLATLLGLGLFSCSKKDDVEYSPIPVLSSLGINTHSINLSVDTGDWIWSYNFVDGDGDIGALELGDSSVVIVKNITLDVEYKFPFPYIPSSAREGKKYLKGNGQVVLRIASFFQPRNLPVGREKDTFQMEVYLKDHAGNQSNTLMSAPIFITRN